jgi:hypothetical protein
MIAQNAEAKEGNSGWYTKLLQRDTALIGTWKCVEEPWF